MRVMWTGASLIEALRTLEDVAWEELAPEFVVAALVADRIGRTCKGIEGPMHGAQILWALDERSARPPRAMSGQEIEGLAEEFVESWVGRRSVGLPERGTDVYRLFVEVGKLVWEERNVQRIAATHAGELAAGYVGLAEKQVVQMVDAAALHAALNHPVRVEVEGVQIVAADVSSGEELWGQWCEWLYCGVPAGFLRWVHPLGVYRGYRKLERCLRGSEVPDEGECRAVAQMMRETMRERNESEVRVAWVESVSEESFLGKLGIRHLWVWVEGRRIWCAVAGDEGYPVESFCWEIGRGVVTNIVVPPNIAPALDVVLSALWWVAAVGYGRSGPGTESLMKAWKVQLANAVVRLAELRGVGVEEMIRELLGGHSGRL
ncbi:MAG: hypothetical protein QN200_10735 [Armatimonadota bacterium]|nr:hypothetical protein [Armatimonadota bacterium]